MANRTESRRTVTVMFTDVTGSTSLGESMDPEAVRRMMERYFDTAAEVIHRHGGTVEKFIGDAVMAVFGVPLLHEDDALRAVRAAVEIRTALDALNVELERDFGVTLQTRMGVNTGEVVAGDPSSGQALVTGDAVNVAARLEQLAAPGEILIGDATHRLTASAVSAEPTEPLVARGKSEPLAAWRVHEASGDHAYERRLDTPLVSREHELAQLRGAFDRAVRQRSCALFTVIGPAGIGKSRLAAEFVGSVERDATVLRGRCLPYGEGITYWPLVEIVRRVAGDDAASGITGLMDGEPDAPDVAALVAGVVGQSDVAVNADEAGWAVRRLFESLARERPLVVVFEDVNWAEPALLELIQHIVEWVREAPVMIICDARDDLLESQPTWAGGVRNASTIFLEPLSDAEADELVTALAGDSPIDDDTRRKVRELAAGNPLFVEQLLATLAAQGRPDVSALSTIHAVISARLDALSGDERAVIEGASVVGKEFSADPVASLLQLDAGATRTILQSLGRRDLIRPSASAIHGPASYRFGHMLVRDTAYARLSKRRRAELHERLADWMRSGTGMRDSEVGEIVGYHLEQAHLLRRELGPLDETARQLASRAARELSEAGLRAVRRFDASAAVSLLGRAAALLADDDPAQLAILPDLALALVWADRREDAEGTLDGAVRRALEAGDGAREHRARLARAYVAYAAAGRLDGLESAAAAAIPVFEQAGDARGLVQAWLWRGFVLQASSMYGDAERALEQARAHLRTAGHVPEERMVFGNLALSLWAGPTPCNEAIERCRSLIAEERERHPTAEAQLALPLAMMLADAGRTDEARELLARLHDMFLSAPGPARAEVANYVGIVLATCGDLAAAEESFLRSIALLEEFSDNLTIAYATARLALLLCDLGRAQEALPLAQHSRAAAAPGDIEAQIFSRSALARALAHLARTDEALPLARQAVELAGQTDSPGRQGDAWLVCSEVLNIAGETQVSREAAAAALHHYERKGITAFNPQALTLLGRPAPTTTQ